eukprot:GHRR01005428.1.p1 GENE.GHRR01005428.1~~GHRR01005428.1.p1  ORF type:complete len:336 (+),score=82.11 GHRR01005428.1:41-1048(+)
MSLQMQLQQRTLHARVPKMHCAPFSAVRPACQTRKQRCVPQLPSWQPCLAQHRVGWQSTSISRCAVVVVSSSNNSHALTLSDSSVSVILLAGGVGKRMGASIPKQYLEIKGQAIATYSLVTFAHMPQVGQIVIVCDPSWRYIFEEHFPRLPSGVNIKWALPGAERQDSVCNGLQQVSLEAQIVAVHDSARPLVTAADAHKCMLDAFMVGAAVLGVPVKPTIKEVDADMMVVKTLNRSKLWEVQTPQCVKPDLLHEGFRLVKEKGLEVTDDVSIIEAMGLPVRITAGSYTNIKVTTPDDMSVAEKFLDEVASKNSSSEATSSSSSSTTEATAVAAV